MRLSGNSIEFLEIPIYFKRSCPVDYFMNPKRFDYFVPRSLDEAVQFLHEEEDAKILAGGQSLLAVMKLRLAAPRVLVDITGLESELSYINDEKEHVAIGALTNYDALDRSEIIKNNFQILAEAAGKIGDQQIRNRGTVGGSCCHADPAGDLPVALLALDATFVARSKSGQRMIPASQFFVDTFTTSLAPDEALTEIRVPFFRKGSGSAYVKHNRRAADFAIVGVGAVLTVGAKNVCEDVRISLGAVAPTPIGAKAAEQYLVGKRLGDDTIAEAGDRAKEGADPPSDIHGSREYRLAMISVFTRRTLKLALGRVRW